MAEPQPGTSTLSDDYAAVESTRQRLLVILGHGMAHRQPGDSNRDSNTSDLGRASALGCIQLRCSDIADLGIVPA